jgi:hypothetical protein
MGLVVAVRFGICLTVIPGVYGAEPGFVIAKRGAMCVFSCPNMLAVVCYGIPKVGAEPSMVVRLLKLLTGWAEGCGIEVLPADAPLVCGLV